jgi:hypothetical protein
MMGFDLIPLLFEVSIVPLSYVCFNFEEEIDEV